MQPRSLWRGACPPLVAMGKRNVEAAKLFSPTRSECVCAPELKRMDVEYPTAWNPNVEKKKKAREQHFPQEGNCENVDDVCTTFRMKHAREAKRSDRVHLRATRFCFHVAGKLRTARRHEQPRDRQQGSADCPLEVRPGSRCGPGGGQEGNRGTTTQTDKIMLLFKTSPRRRRESQPISQTQVSPR